MIPADAVGTILNLALKHGPDLIKGILDLFSTQQQQGMRPAQAGWYTSQPQQGQQGQQMIPADAVSTILKLARPYIESGTQRPGVQPASTGGGGGQGQQLYPAELISTLIGLGVTFGPSLIEGILDLFSTQPSMQPASTGGGGGQGQQLYPAELISTLIGLGVTFGPSLIEGILDLFSTQQQAMQPAMMPSFIPPNSGQECSSSRWPWIMA
ncbi:hypothetical protein ABZW11_11110 [Nonomuraea sp. NPDC004580]|uniref:hypothetical protein n=1 Tax=Nonomuraea sp. NPDC004580 TaxID=3154552 RepID=UPI0033A7B098